MRIVPLHPRFESINQFDAFDTPPSFGMACWCYDATHVVQAAAMKRAERGLENILERERRPSAAVSAASSNRPSGGTSEAIGVSVPAGSESAGQLQTVRSRRWQAWG